MTESSGDRDEVIFHGCVDSAEGTTPSERPQSSVSQKLKRDCQHLACTAASQREERFAEFGADICMFMCIYTQIAPDCMFRNANQICLLLSDLDVGLSVWD